MDLLRLASRVAFVMTSPWSYYDSAEGEVITKARAMPVRPEDWS